MTSIEGCAFYGCSGLTSVIIPNGVTSIGGCAFYGCSSLTSVTIPNSVTSIGDRAFKGCTGLIKVIVPDIDIAAWCGISFYSGESNPLLYAHHLYVDEETEITDLVIPNSVTGISSVAFRYCSGLTSVTIPNSVTRIGNVAFSDCDISEVISKIENPFNISTYTFSDNTFYNATLYVPTGTIEKYKATEGWKKFVFFEEIKGEQCATPTISYKNGKLTFNCETEGATCKYTIADTDIKSGSSDEVQLSVTYTISVYAKKAGYENSETATGTLCWIDQQPDAEGIVAEDAVHEIKALPVLIQTHGGTISVQGLDAGTEVFVYSTDGKQQGSAMVVNGATTIRTSLQPGSVAIVKIGEKSIKVLLK